MRKDNDSQMSAETAALAAKLDNDDDTVYELLTEMLPGELKSLADTLDELSADARFVLNKKRRGE
jgi:hypothetical protein